MIQFYIILSIKRIESIEGINIDIIIQSVYIYVAYGIFNELENIIPMRSFQREITMNINV